MILPKPMLDDAMLAAVDGGRVGIFTDRSSSVRRLMTEIVDEFPELREAATLRWTNGDQEISFPNGGRVLFLSVDLTRSLRGTRLDRCYVPIGTREWTLDEIRPALATSSDGLITGY